MSLVDYASSSDDDSDTEEQEENKDRNEPEPTSSAPQDSHLQQNVIASSFQQSNGSSHSSIEKLPDATMLLNSPLPSSLQMSSSDHSSRVAAAMAESASRKRESNGSMLPPHSKLSKGNLPHSRNVPDTIGGLLIPPQLSGSGGGGDNIHVNDADIFKILKINASRSNVVTEDICKLFVKRHADTSG